MTSERTLNCNNTGTNVTSNKLISVSSETQSFAATILKYFIDNFLLLTRSTTNTRQHYPNSTIPMHELAGYRVNQPRKRRQRKKRLTLRMEMSNQRNFSTPKILNSILSSDLVASGCLDNPIFLCPPCNTASCARCSLQMISARVLELKKSTIGLKLCNAVPAAPLRNALLSQ